MFIRVLWTRYYCKAIKYSTNLTSPGLLFGLNFSRMIILILCTIKIRIVGLEYCFSITFCTICMIGAGKVGIVSIKSNVGVVDDNLTCNTLLVKCVTSICRLFGVTAVIFSSSIGGTGIQVTITWKNVTIGLVAIIRVWLSTIYEGIIVEGIWRLMFECWSCSGGAGWSSTTWYWWPKENKAVRR